jgi:hypothetical protein
MAGKVDRNQLENGPNLAIKCAGRAGPVLLSRDPEISFSAEENITGFPVILSSFSVAQQRRRHDV